LLKQHQKTWIGGLADAIKSDENHWERGFLVGCRLKTAAKNSLQRVTGEPAWRSIRDLAFQAFFGPESDDIVPFLKDPVMSGLRRLHWISPRVAARLLEEKVVPKLEGVVLGDEPDSWKGYERLGVSMLGVLYPFSASALANVPRSVSAFMIQHGDVKVSTAPAHVKTLIVLDAYSNPFGPPCSHRITLRRRGESFDSVEVALTKGRHSGAWDDVAPFLPRNGELRVVGEPDAAFKAAAAKYKGDVVWGR
jgi:hypothetical protein